MVNLKVLKVAESKESIRERELSKKFDSVIDAILSLEYGDGVTTEKALDLLRDYKNDLVDDIIEYNLRNGQSEASTRRILRSIVSLKRMDYERG